MSRIRRWAGDFPLVALALALSLFGVAMIYSAGILNVPSPVTQGAWQRQLLWLGISLVVFTAAVRIQPRWIEWAAYPAYVFAMILLAATLVVGTGAGPGENVGRWLRVGGVGFQPSELAKLATVLAVARFLAAREEPPMYLKDLVAPGAMIAAPLGLVALQPDLGTSLVFVAILFGVLFWARTPLLFLFFLASPGLALILAFNTWVWSVYFVGLAVVLYLCRYRLFLYESTAVILTNLAAGTIALPIWSSLADYQRSRLLVFLDPSTDPRGAGWHLIQSKVAIGSGGLFGKGFTEGTQKRLDFLPEQHTDFIFSVVGEELGFLGVAAALLLFGLLLHRLLRLAEETEDPFAGMVLLGIFSVWLVHIFVNIGMTVGIAPITGIPLPFLSYGGTFLLTCWIFTALAARLSREG
jgi:rod shape determining protein RodA